MTYMQSDPKHLNYIDAVRGYAFLGVLMVHTALAVGPFPGRDVFLFSGYGVQLFFLASAITLCHSMSSRKSFDRHPVAYFYLRRIFRIAPLFWTAIVFYWTFPTVIPPSWLSSFAPFGVHPSYFAMTAFFLNGWHPYTFNSIVPGGWSIAVEMTFYAVFPLCFHFLNSLRKSAIALLFAFVWTDQVFSHPHWLRTHLYPGVPDFVFYFFQAHWFPSQIVVFLIGIFSYHFLNHPLVFVLTNDRFWSVSLLCSCLFILLTLRPYPENPAFVSLYLLYIAALAGLIVSISGKGLRFFANRAICYTGRISYSCYLVHFAALGMTFKLFGGHHTAEPFFDTQFPLSNLLLFAKLAATAFILTVLVSTITLHFFENAGIALGRRMIQRITEFSGTKNPG